MKIARLMLFVFLCTFYQTNQGFIDELLEALGAAKDHVMHMVTEKAFYATYGASTVVSALAIWGSYATIVSRHGKIAGEQVCNFVKDSLRDAGFTKEQIDAIEVRESKGFYSFRNILFVPFSDEDLARAQQYYETQDDHEEFEAGLHKKEVDDLRRKLSIRMKDVSERDVQIYRQFTGGVTKDSIPFWEGAILHEASHIIHHDSEKNIAVKVGFVPPVFAYCVAWLNQIFPGRSWATLKSQELQALILAYAAIGHFVSLPFGKHAERRSDQEIINRTHDPALLRATADAFAVDAKFKGLNNNFIRLLYELADEHPSSDRRAAYLRKALEELEKNNNNT